MNKSFNSSKTIIKRLEKVINGRVVTNDNLYIAFEKDQTNEKDRDFVSAMVSTLKTNGLITVQKTDGWPKRRISITLTDKGVSVLNGHDQQPDEPAAPTGKPMSLQDITDMVKQWNRQNPSFWIDPTPKLIDKELPVEH